jgi:hypothetical protein
MNFGIECQYLKFSVSRRLIQRFQSSHSGGMMSAIGLLEVSSVQDEVGRLHRSCLKTLRSYWHAAAQERDVEILSGFLEEFFVVFQQADFMMKDMLIKYPNSVVFLRAYGAFMRDICQDKIKANEMFNKAENLENSSEGPDDIGGSKSLSSSTFRTAAANSWTQSALQKDIDMMGNVSKNMRNTLLLLVTVSTLVFCVLEFVLLESVSGHISDIFALNRARSDCETAMYSARDAVLAAYQNDSATFSSAMTTLSTSATTLKSYISDSNFNADTYTFFFFSAYIVLRPQLVGISLPDEVSPASGLQEFADNCFFFAATSMSDVNLMIKNNDYSSSAGFALRFVLGNGDSPVMPSLDKGAMLLQGQAVSFVYLSGVFYVVAGLVVVLLGLHMVVLARRLLSEAIVLLRTSTICISASLHINQVSRKSLSAYYKNLDQDAVLMMGEGGLEADGHEALQEPENPGDIDSDVASVAGSLNPVVESDTRRIQFQTQSSDSETPTPEDHSEVIASFTNSAAVEDYPGPSEEIPHSDDVTYANIPSESHKAAEATSTLSSHIARSEQDRKPTHGATFANETHVIPSKLLQMSNNSDTSTDDSSLHSSQKQIRHRKMMIIVSLCIFAVVAFNVSSYIYLEPVKIGSRNFMNLQKLLSIQSDIDLPLARVLPTLMHIGQLANPHLSGQPRMTQMEHLNILKLEFKSALEYWQMQYSDMPHLSGALQNQLFIGQEM